MTHPSDPTASEETSPAVPLTEPAGGVPPLIDTPDALAQAVAAFAAGTGPIAADAERASGFRYGQATYLAQFKRAGAGIALVDTAALPDLSSLQEAVGAEEFVFHAASQDLPGMRDLGITPAKVFDTELAARLLGWPKVGLAAVVERVLGLALAKEHSAQDWSTRPLPHDWLVYAALDVEVLVEVRDHLRSELEAAGKLDWALQEFEAARVAQPSEARPDPWRRTSGCHQVRDPRGLGIVRELWLSRDREAQRRDMSPGRVLRDAAIVSAAQARPASYDDLVALPEWRSRGTKRAAARWWPTIERALTLPDKDLPARRGPASDGPPPPRAWRDKRPDAATRLALTKEAIQGLVDKHGMPAENLMQPDAVRRACWEHRGGGETEIRNLLASRGARQWQLDLVAPVLAQTFVRAAELDAAGTDASDGVVDA
ncbi:HRDC domain-containing protein [Demequina capsici]|uniref:HRDC domain-containing protein n=1 Tax=Demequina capsici TaxID=3075620 RepID=A0AA96F9A5_9MICO|nr:HRDC domain-containing protein [Demequina sp. OYTSA14]WNM25717.1 HRDC domain-containing protein [Demequina sp. OYTSA14]